MEIAHSSKSTTWSQQLKRRWINVCFAKWGRIKNGFDLIFFEVIFMWTDSRANRFPCHLTNSYRLFAAIATIWNLRNCTNSPNAHKNAKSKDLKVVNFRQATLAYQFALVFARIVFICVKWDSAIWWAPGNSLERIVNEIWLYCTNTKQDCLRKQRNLSNCEKERIIFFCVAKFSYIR